MVDAETFSGLKFEVGGRIGTLLFELNKLFIELKGADGGGGGGGLDRPPSKKSSNVGNVGGAPPGPKRSEPKLLLPQLL